jgi:hypothetical protein
VKAASGAAPTKETIMGELQGIVRFTFHSGKVEEFALPLTSRDRIREFSDRI